MQREVTLHIGPTNSGKTFQALEALKAASTGTYLGPLRLLAWEVAERLNVAGVATDLLTGQECERVDGAQHLSATIEMLSTTQRVDVAVIDEVQLLGDGDRGGAWTRALLGAPASHVHCCGDPSVEPLVRRLCDAAGEKLTVVHYERLSTLSVCDSLPSIRDVQAGDCVVAFSRKNVYELKQQIESASRGRLRCCVVYGALPPETRREQARRFNEDTDGYNVLVATDAIGMGLNLAIKRVVFSQVEKFDGTKVRPLTAREVRQIGGRAGRHAVDGFVTAMSDKHTRFVKKRLSASPPPLLRAGLSPSLEVVEALAVRRPRASFSQLMEEATATPPPTVDNPLFFVCDAGDTVDFAHIVDTVDSKYDALTIPEKYAFTQAPGNTRRDFQVRAFARFVRGYCRGESVRLNLHVPGFSYDPDFDNDDDDDDEDKDDDDVDEDDYDENDDDEYYDDYDEDGVDDDKDAIRMEDNIIRGDGDEKGETPFAGGHNRPTTVQATPKQLQQLEDRHAVIDMYLWLSRRLDGFDDRARTQQLGVYVSECINSGIINFEVKVSRKKKKRKKNDEHSFTANDDERYAKRSKKEKQKAKKRKKMMMRAQNMTRSGERFQQGW
jgi:ATP-dependent RNA helicase SUPV3L1/SUV3